MPTTTIITHPDGTTLVVETAAAVEATAAGAGGGAPQLPADDAAGLAARKHMFAAGGLYPAEGYSGPDQFTLSAPGRGAFAAAAPLTLTYFAIRALGELPTLILEQAGYPYSAVRVFDTTPQTPKVFVELKKRLPFGRLPLVEDGALRVTQSGAVARYLAQKVGLDGGSAAANARCAMLYDQLSDTR
jgi:hypothetical protein